MPYYKYRIAIFVFFLALGFLGQAQAVVPPYLDKPKVRLSISPGESSYGDILITNPSDETKRIRVYVADWYYLPAADGTKDFVAANTTGRSCASWISFSPAEFTLPAFGQQRVSYVVKAPRQAQGGYYAVLFFESQAGQARLSEGQGIAGGLSVVVRVGSLFYVETKGATRRAASIGNLKLEKEGASGFLLVQADFRNTGNVDITAGGSFHIMDKSGLIHARSEFNNVYTFPGNSTKLKAVWKDPIPKGAYDLVLTIDLGKAQEEAGLERGPLIIKEAEVQFNDKGEPATIGELK